MRPLHHHSSISSARPTPRRLARHKAYPPRVSSATIANATTPIVNHAQRLLPAQPPTGQRGRAKQSDTGDLLRRLHDLAEEALRFLADPRVPFDNNQAERDIRVPKLKQKISGAFGPQKARPLFCTIRFYLATLRKQSRDLFESLVLTFRGQPPEPIFSG